MIDGSPEPMRMGEAGAYYYVRPGQVLVLTADLTPVQQAAMAAHGLTPNGGPVGQTDRAIQRAARRTTASAFGVAVFELPAGGDLWATIDALRAAGVRCDPNYVTAPTPIRSHAVSYADPADLDDVTPRRPPQPQPSVRVGVLDTGRPYYADEFRAYYVQRENERRARTSGRILTSPTSALDLLAARFVAPPAAGPQASAGGRTIELDEDTMISGFGRLLHPHAGHGLFVGSIIARHAPNVELLAESTMSPDAVGDLHDMLVDLDHASDEGCRVLNMSMGFHARRAPDGSEPCPQVLAHALARLTQRNTKLIASAGNDGSNRPMWPAAHESVGAVGGLLRDGTPAEWSNYGDWVDACAVGEEVVSDHVHADWDYPDETAKRFRGAATWSGTSFAAPLVTALLAVEYGQAITAAAAAQRNDVIVQAVWKKLLDDRQQAGRVLPNYGAVFSYP